MASNVENNAISEENKNVFRVQGFTCTNCAGKFEKNVKDLPGVKDAQVNFGASKITVYGKTSVQELEKSWRFRELKSYARKKNV